MYLIALRAFVNEMPLITVRIKAQYFKEGGSSRVPKIDYSFIEFSSS